MSDILYRASTEELESHTNTDGEVNVVSVVVVKYPIVHFVDELMLRWMVRRFNIIADRHGILLMKYLLNFMLEIGITLLLQGPGYHLLQYVSTLMFD